MPGRAGSCLLAPPPRLRLSTEAQEVPSTRPGHMAGTQALVIFSLPWVTGFGKEHWPLAWESLPAPPSAPHHPHQLSLQPGWR